MSKFTAQISASAGVCSSLASTISSAAQAYERADFALFEAKRFGRGRIETFDATHERLMRRDGTIAHLLASIDLASELAPFFQPIMDAKTHRITAFEALVRWTSAELGPVGPHEFIPIAERTDLILRISRLVLREALAQMASWPVNINLKINLSVRDLMSVQQTEALVGELAAWPIDPRRVTFEITETILAESLEKIRANVDVLRSSGCKIAIDDFGVGYSSLSYIHALAPDVIKIDRCFIQQVVTNEVTPRVIRTIVELARNVGARTVAEGVEDADQARALTDLGCDALQGYFFSKPVSASAARDLMDQENATSRRMLASHASQPAQLCATGRVVAGAGL